MFLSKYGAARHIYIPVVKRAVVDFAVGADWTPSAGDVKISKDGGAAANVTNLPAAIAMGNGAIWDFSLTATEMQAAQIVVTVADSATKAVEDQSFIIETYGNASGQHAVDLSDSVRAGLTAIPNVASGSAGALLVDGTGTAAISNSSGKVLLQATQSGVTIPTVTTVTNQLTAAQIATGVWQDATAGDFTAALSVGKSLMNGVSLGTGLTVNDITTKTGFALTSAYDFAKGTTAMTEAYAANGVAPTPVQAILAMHQMLMDFGISGTSYTVKKLDNATTAFVVTLNDATSPTAAART